MDETFTSIDTITLRVPLDIWAPPPMSQGVPRTHVESLYVRVQTSGGVVGWGESFGTARPMVIAAFDNWIKRLAIGQKVSDTELIPRIERMLLSLSRSGPLAHALAGLDIALWDILARPARGARAAGAARARRLDDAAGVGARARRHARFARLQREVERRRRAAP